MALPSTFSLGSLDFTLMPPTGSNRVVRINTASDASAPDFLNIQHQLLSIKGSKVGLDRRMLQEVRTVLDETGFAYQEVHTYTVAKPRLAAFTLADTKLMGARLVNFINHPPYYEAWLRGEA